MAASRAGARAACHYAANRGLGIQDKAAGLGVEVRHLASSPPPLATLLTVSTVLVPIVFPDSYYASLTTCWVQKRKAC